jgi:cyclopropane-fatty-acyl-phospholipid synthase
MAVSHKHADAIPAEGRATATTERILDHLFSPHRPFTVRLWNGATLPAAGDAQFTLVLTHPGALRRMLLPPTELSAGEAFVRGDFDIEGDLEAAVGAMAQAALSKSLREWLQVGSWALTLPRTAVEGTVPPRARLSGRRHTLARDRTAVRHHYDVGNDFYALWLGRRLVYSCAYFPMGTEDIDTAQEAKLEHICRKLRLRSGERVLDIGCGWGGLVRYAAAHYGVHAVGVTLSEPQARYAQEQIRSDGLEDRAEVRVVDYREVTDEPFDKLVSVGMFEHVGRERLPEYFGKAWDLLRPGGLFLNHGIAARPSIVIRRTRALGPTFMQAHVFPDGELEPIADTLVAAEAIGFEVRDVENLREHYARTLRLWRRNLEAHTQRAVELVGEGRFRTWRLFLAASAQGFASGRTEVFQALLARPDAAGTVDLPWSRAHLYT